VLTDLTRMSLPATMMFLSYQGTSLGAALFMRAYTHQHS
jgi:hypothetical protein